jgi:hypothetical protein
MGPLGPGGANKAYKKARPCNTEAWLVKSSCYFSGRPLFRKVFSTAAYQAPLSPGVAGFFGRKAVAPTAGVRSFAAFTGNAALGFGAHCGEAAAAFGTHAVGGTGLKLGGQYGGHSS